MLEDKLVAKSLLDLVRCTIGMELKHMRYYTCRPPGMFIGLIHDDEGIKRATLELCHDLWGGIAGSGEEGPGGRLVSGLHH